MISPFSQLRRTTQRAGRLGTVASARVRNEVRAGSFAQRAGANGMIANGGVAVFLATGPENVYQFDQWRRPLERLAQRQGVFVIVDRPDTGARVLAESSLPVAFARGSAALEDLVNERDIRVVLYLNQVEANFRMLRFTGPVHIQIGHGESDKAGSVSHQHKAYDLTFVGGEAGSGRLGDALRGFDAEAATVQVGRPQLDHDYPGAPDWPADSGFRVWYAPTWEGDRPSITYGSLVSHGVEIVETLITDPKVRMIYRPHPRTGTASREHRVADAKIRSLLDARDSTHLIDHGGYGWQWAFADACVTDISAVAYDWLPTAKPLVITEPVDRRVYRPASRLLDNLPLLPAEAAGEVGSLLETQRTDDVTRQFMVDLAHHYFGDIKNGASTLRFEAAIDAARESARR